MDELIKFFLMEGNSPYLFSILFMLVFFVFQVGSLLIGLDVFGFIDDALPDFDMDVDADMEIDVDVDVDIGIDVDSGNLPIHYTVFSWLNLGKVPFMVLVTIFLMIFGFSGYIFNYIALSIIQTTLPRFLLVPISIILSLLGVGFLGKKIGKLIPSEETSAVSTDSFVGKIATITIGTAKKDYPAQAKLQDKFGRTHYVMVVPIKDEDVFVQGTQVLLVEKSKNNFLADKFESI